MDTTFLLKAVIALAPVFTLLIVFDRLDAFDLIPFRSILVLLGVGGAIALVTFFANWRVMDGFPIGFSNYSKYVAPVIEESLKCIPIVVLYVTNRIGFKLDAAIAGFAVGAGFSMIENGWYLFTMTDANVSAWLVRGFGTAVMHGGATALFAVIGHEFTERQAEAAADHYRFNPLLFIPGLLLAMFVHSAFNHFPHEPVLTMAMTLMLVPVILFLTFARSERATSQWLANDQAAHRKMLDDIRAGHFAESERGRAIQAAVARFKGVSEDAFAYAELKTELVLRAEELILAATEGKAAPVGVAEKEKFERLSELELSLGHALLAVINSRLAFTRNDLWELGRLHSRAKKVT